METGRGPPHVMAPIPLEAREGFPSGLYCRGSSRRFAIRCRARSTWAADGPRRRRGTGRDTREAPAGSGLWASRNRGWERRCAMLDLLCSRAGDSAMSAIH